MPTARRVQSTLLDAALGSLTVGLLGAIKHTDRRRMANFAGAFMRKIGPLFKEHRLGREQLRAAFPEKSDAEIETHPRRRLGQSRPDRHRVRPSRRILRRRLRHADAGRHHLSAGIEGALRVDHEKRAGDDRICRASRQLGIARASAPS